MRRLTLLAFCLAASLEAQYPPEIQWRKIRTAHFEVVFPREIEADAQRAANMLETLFGPLTESLATGLKRTTVLLPNQGITRYVGGYVSLFPRMATFNSMPSQEFWGTNDWLNVLAANEGRHLAQIAKMNHGAARVVSALFGEAGQASVLAWTLPDWWTAGDARVAETTMLRGGVGQFASSEATTRALLLSGQHYSYMKAIHGSFRDGVPSPDELGSFMVSHVNRTSGADAWKQIMERTANQPWNPLALSFAMKKETGRSAATNYYEAMSELGELWKSKAEPIEFSKPFILNQAPKHVFTGYYQPVFEADGSVLAQKTGLDTFPLEMVRIHPDGREEKLFRIAPSVVTSNRTSVVNGRMVLDEYVPDLRWRRGYSEIVIRDMATGRTRRLTHHTRFMNPVLSPDGARVAVVEFLPDRQCSLVVLDAGTGAELRRLPSPSNDMIWSPAWSEDGRRLAIVIQDARGRALSIVDVESGGFQEAIPHTDEEIASPVFWGGYVLYKSSYGGAMNIYAVETASGRRFRVTSAKFGANFPSISPDRTKLLYSDYTSRGYDLAELPLDPSAWSPVDTVANISLGYHGPYRDFSSEAPATQYPVDHYRPSLHLFEFHSWGFTSGPPDLGFGLISNDKMGLMDFNASVLYNTNEGTAGFRTGVSYNRFFPVLDFSFSDRNRSLQFASGTENWTERAVTAGFHVPLNLSRGYYNTGLSIGAEVQSISLQGGGLAPLSYGLAFSRVRQRSARDLAPPWAQELRFTYRQTPWPDSFTGNFLSAGGRFAVPGFARHHTLQFDGGYERNAGNYFFSSQLFFPRGYTAVTGSNLAKAGATYGFPLFYPDWALGQFLYIKRVSANLFYDYGKVDSTLYRSTGVEAVFDLNVFHFPTLRAGVRYPYRLDLHNARVRPFLEYRW
ncbi:conserved exported hypothetical protein [Candidatus Sulfopaludibacter sp. SbA6]|nr:conserved exported hypothetical protein [Candidatus Sulfopaludibacter sp. SbA6]